jgi:glyoxylase-like metal-dependent hydrolase (beta-lactamase superfamily II)
MLIRRILCALAFTFALKSAAYAQGGQAPPPPGPPPALVKVKEDLYVLQNQAHTMGDLIAYGGNATILLTDAGVLLIDSKSDREHDDLIAKLKTLTDKPVKNVVLTHNHGDHTGGAAKLQAMGATLFISADDRENMMRGGNQPGVPDLTYIGRAQITLGGKTAELYQFRGHTRGDTAVYFPAQRVIVLGDLLTTADTIPPIVNYADGGSWTDWRKSITQILRMDFDTVIPGHGPVITKSQLAETLARMTAIQERVRALVREKKTEMEISQALVKEFNWGAGPSAGNIPGMMQEFR